MTDVIMPQMDGRRLAEHLAARVPGIRTLFISGYAADLLAREDGLGEGTELLEKPFSGSALLESVRRLLDRPGGRRS
ncbi:MAG: hypothetical protein HY812_20445 [Planctomycetes bacterium]|nr:hypothetical protein [Planctomycetota bacterium]